MIPRRGDREPAPAPEVDDGVEDHPADGGAHAGGRELDDVRRRAERDAAEEPLHARAVEAAQHHEHREADREDQVEPVQEGEAEQHPAQQGVAAGASRVGDPSAFQRDGEAEEAERDSSDPAEGGEPDRRDDDDERDQRAGERHRPAPVTCQRVDAHDDADLLEQRDEALGGQRGAEHLVHAGQRPQAPRPVQMEEVPVRKVAVQQTLREDEHEALFHGRPLTAQQPSERDQEREPDDPEDDRVALSGCEASPTAQRRRHGLLGVGALAGELRTHEVVSTRSPARSSPSPGAAAAARSRRA